MLNLCEKQEREREREAEDVKESRRKKKLLLLGKQCLSNDKIDVDNCLLLGFIVRGLLSGRVF